MSLKYKILIFMAYTYIRFVTITSKISHEGNIELLKQNEKLFTAYFWHENSFTLYPMLRGHFAYTLTTTTERGIFVKTLSEKFGYRSIRVPDENDGGNHILKIRRQVSKNEPGHIALAADGPLGPYHEVSPFVLAVSVTNKRNILPMCIDVKRKIILKKRWDKFQIMLPFNKITYRIGDPIEVSKSDLDENYEIINEKIKQALNF